MDVTILGNASQRGITVSVVSIWQVPSLGLTKTDLGLAMLLTISPKTIVIDRTRVRKLEILVGGLA